jgi:hypothetical protein
MIVYVLLLLFVLIPVTVLAYMRIKAGRYPLPLLCNNVVVSRIKLRKSMGLLSPILFWGFHAYLLYAALEIEAWLAVIVFAAYMVASALLSNEIKKKGVGINPETAGVVASHQVPTQPTE